jgi:hypothetical protein
MKGDTHLSLSLIEGVTPDLPDEASMLQFEAPSAAQKSTSYWPDGTSPPVSLVVGDRLLYLTTKRK